jgi:hypothetical protein
VVSALGLGASIVSVVIAAGAKRQAKKVATLGPKAVAIDHLHKAVWVLQRELSLSPSTIQSIRAAKNRADLVFSSQLNSYLDRTIQKADDLLQQQVSQKTEPDLSVIEAFIEDLQSLIQRMNDEAAP